MLRETSAARIRSKSVTWARTPAGRPTKSRKAAAKAMDCIEVFLTMRARISPQRPRRKRLATSRPKPHILRWQVFDAHRPDPAHDHDRAARDQGAHRGNRGLDRATVHLARPPYRLHRAHFGLPADPGERVAGCSPRS